ncbi:MAG: hypothetical protein MN733_09700 [Nitrososphaera sp.]|nr:hypothetical protein [Nitrososphaera sp.]
MSMEPGYIKTKKDRIDTARRAYETEMVAIEIATTLKDYSCADLQRIQTRVKELLGVTL